MLAFQQTLSHTHSNWFRLIWPNTSGRRLQVLSEGNIPTNISGLSFDHWSMYELSFNVWEYMTLSTGQATRSESTLDIHGQQPAIRHLITSICRQKKVRCALPGEIRCGNTNIYVCMHVHVQFILSRSMSSPMISNVTYMWIHVLPCMEVRQHQKQRPPWSKTSRTQLSKTPSANHHLNLRPAPPTSRASSWVWISQAWISIDILPFPSACHIYSKESVRPGHAPPCSPGRSSCHVELITPSPHLYRKWNESGFFGLKFLLQSALARTKWISSTGSITSTPQAFPHSTRAC